MGIYPIKLDSVVIIKMYWNSGCGIAMVQDKYTRDYKFYIKSYSDIGRTEEQDAKSIAEWGNTFPTEAGKALFLGFDFSEDWIENNPEYFI